MRSLIVSIIILWIVRPVYADLQINEIYPAPEPGQFEWVELYNDSSDVAQTAEYVLVDEKNNLMVFEGATIGANTYGIATSSGVLNNSGDTLNLKKTAGESVDTQTYSEGIDATESFTRCRNNNIWITTTSITRGGDNTPACSVSPTSSPTPPPAPSEESFDSFSIYISEIMSYPDDENEWVEFYNNSDAHASLQGWYLDDTENGGASPRQFNLEIGPKQYAVYELPSSMFNNDGDRIRLIDPHGSPKETLTISSSIKGNSWGKTELTSPVLCLQSPSKGIQNQSCITPTSKPQTPSPTQKVPTVNSVFTASPSATIISKPTQTSTPSAHIPTHPHASQGAYLLPSSKKNPGSVLGTKTASSSALSNDTRKKISIISFSICVLTIIAVLVKIKK